MNNPESGFSLRIMVITLAIMGWWRKTKMPLRIV
jgi:hypothetical protein